MAISRSSIIRGPAIVRMGSQSFYSKDDITVDITPETFDIVSSTGGKLSERTSDVVARITFTPVGAWTANQLTVLYPYTNPTIGGSVFGSSDTSVQVWPIDGTERFTFACGAITKMPSLIMTPAETLMGEVEITCIIANNQERSTAGSLYTYSATAAFTAAPNDERNFALSDVLTVPYTATFSGPAGWTSQIESTGGFSIDFDLQTTPIMAANIGTVDHIISGLDITCTFQPLNFTAKQLMDRLAVDGNALGKDISSAAGNLTITGGSASTPKVVLNNLRLRSAPMLYSLENLRSDDIEFFSTRPTGAGTMFTVGFGP